MAKTALIIPCYNAERYLESLKRQIESLNPKFDEVVLVDDGSTDGTVTKGRKNGLEIVPLGKNLGPGAARNAAAKKTRAEWIHFHDADDILHQNYLERVLPLINNSVDLILSSTDYISEKSQKHLSRWQYDPEAYKRDPIGEGFRKGVNTTSSLIRKDKFDQIGGFNEVRRCWEDVDMHLRLLLAGCRVCVLPEVLCTSIRHSRGVSSKTLYFNQCRQEFLFEYQKYIPKIKQKDLCNAIVENSSEIFSDGNLKGFYISVLFAFRLGWEGPSSANPIVSALLKKSCQRSKLIIYALQLLFRKVRKIFQKETIAT